MTERFFYVPHPHDNRRPAFSHHVFAMLGVAGSKWPAAGLTARPLYGLDSNGHSVDVWVGVWPADHVTLQAKAAKRGLDWRGRPRKSSAHRVYAACPGCGVSVSLGRLIQHRCKVQP